MKRAFFKSKSNVIILVQENRRLHSFLCFLLLSWLSFLVLSPGALHAQTLNLNDDVPSLSACSEAKEFTVRVDKGPAECANGQLVIQVPVGLEFVPGSVKVDGVAAVESNVSLSGATINVRIPAGPKTESVAITFSARAKCEAITAGSSGLAIAYTLNGCNSTQTGTSNSISILSAVLQVSVSPDLTEGILGDVIVRTITVKNNGNGTITGFTVPATHAAGLERVSGGDTGAWSYDASQKVYRYSGTLQSGAVGSSVSFQESVKIVSCDLLTSNYRAFYGCDTECLAGSGAPILATIKMSQTKRPNLSVTVTSLPLIECFNQKYPYTLTIKNTGVVDATDVDFTIGTAAGVGASYIVSGSVKVDGTSLAAGPSSTSISAATGDLYGTSGKYDNQIVKIPLIPAGGSVVLTFEQYYATPVANANCALLPHDYTRADTYYSAAYTNSMTCDENGNPPAYSIAKTNARAKLVYSFAGANVGEVDIVEGIPYTADFKIDNLVIPSEGLQPGGFFEMKIKLSPSIQNFDPSKVQLFKGQDFVPNGANGFQIIPLGNNEYSLRIYYGTPAWPTGTTFSSTDGSMRLKFPLELNCPSPDFFYEISTGLNKGGSCTTVPFNCPQRVDVKAHCGGDCVNGGMVNGMAKLRRLSLGFADTNNDAKPDNNLPLDPYASLPGVEVRSFVGGDIIEIYQKNTVSAGVPPTAVNVSGKWNDGKFVVDFANLPQVEAVPASGSVKITRGANTYIVKNIPVTKTGNLYQISLNIANWLSNSAINLPSSPALPIDFAFQTGDVIESALQLTVKTFTATSELKIFPATSSLIYNGVDYACGGDYRASGYYGSTALTTTSTAGSFNVPDCSSANAGPSFSTILSIGGRKNRNALFYNEFRQFATPNKVVLTVPNGLTLTGYRVSLLDNALGGTLFKDVAITAMSNGDFEIDLKPILEELKGGSAGGYIDEGFTLNVQPVVTVNCDAKNTETIVAKGIVAGTFSYNKVDYYNATDVATGPVNLVYNTDNEKLAITAAQAAVNTFTAEAKWVLTVNNSSSFHNFQNLWIAKTGGVNSTNVVRLQRITSLSDTTHIGASILPTDNMFKVGAVGKSTTTYYLLTAKFDHCGPGNIEVSTGNDCAGYPTDLAVVECKNSLLKLSYTPEQANLQTVITKQPAGSSNPKLCAPFEYVVEINNAGGQAKDLFLNVPIHELVGLEYVPGSLRASIAYPGSQANPAFIAIDDQGNVTNDNNGLRLAIPASILPTLNQGNRFYISFQLLVKDCGFESGHAIKVTPGGKNFCGSSITDDRINSAESNRIIMKGAPDQEAVVSFVSKVDVQAAADGSHLFADYNLKVINSGIGAFAVPITGQAARTANPLSNEPIYNFAIELPAGWEIDDSPQEFIAVNKATYKGYFPGRGYVFQINETINAGEEINFEHIRLIYRPNDAASLACGYVFGRIHEQILAEFTPESDCPQPAECTMNLLTAEHFTDFVLQQPTAPVVPATQEFCVTVGATLADIAVKDATYASWFASAVDVEELPLTTLLENGKTYYISNHFVEGAICASDRVPVTIKLDAEPVVSAGIDQVNYNTGTFTLNGSQPTGNQVGLWTVVDGSQLPVVITNADLYNTTVTVIDGAIVNLKWTITNGSCEVSDEMQLKFVRIIDLAVEKKANKASHQVGEAISYTVTVTNNGPGTIFKDEAFLIEEVLPKGLIDPAFIANDGTYDAATGIYKPAADLLPKGTVTLTVTGRVTLDYEGTELTNKVRVEVPKDVVDPDLTNNDDEVTTSVTRVVDLSVMKVVDKPQAVAGEFVTYTITITNNGPSALKATEAIGINELLPAALSNVTYSSTDGTYDAVKKQLVLLKDLPKNGKVLFIVKAKIAASTVAGASILNRVEVTVPPGITDPNPDNNVDEETVLVSRLTDLVVEKTVANAKPIMGTETSFAIRVTNNGPSDATEVVVLEQIPSGYKFISASGTKGNYAVGTGKWTIGNMVLGSSETLTISVTVLAEGEYKNTATVSGKEKDPNIGNNESSIVPVPLASPPIAVDDRETTKANTAVDILILQNDKPGLTNSPLVPGSVEIISQPKNGQITIDANGKVVYTPNHGFVGEDTFVYRVKDELGFWSNNATVTITIEANDFFVPNIFTPNGDGTNDNFEIVGIEGFDHVALTILNRWGNEVYKNDRYDNTWSGKGLNEGTYYYIITLYKAGTQKVLKGWVTIKTK